MMIKYNDTNLHAMPHVTMVPKTFRNKRTGKTRTEMRVDTNQSPQDINWLRPGWNEFPKHVWDQNKDHPAIKKMIKDGKLEIMNHEIKVKQGKKTISKVIGQDDEPIDLKMLPEALAIDIVTSTLNRDILQRWLDEEMRHKVKRALTKQIEPLLNSTSKEED